MYRGGKAVRNKEGVIVKEAIFQTKLKSGTVARVQSDKRWFGNTRTIGQKELESFREAMSVKKDDAYTVLLRANKLPMSLLADHNKVSKMNMLEVDPFKNTFGPKAQRKKPKVACSSMEELNVLSDAKLETYSLDKDPSLLKNKEQLDLAANVEVQDKRLQAGQSKRIWNELYKVIDSSDIILHVLDARDPLGTRCKNVENYIKKEASHKHLIFVINKCDLVPTWVTAKWVKYLSQFHPTLAFHASINNSFGKGSLITLLRQFSKLHQDKKQISVGFVGYPNTGKSSIINTLRAEKVCNVAPVPGETKVWQYITLMKRIYLIDCPGVVYPSPEESETDVILKGVCRVENLQHPEDYIEEILKRVKKEYMVKTYGIAEWEDEVDFLTQLANVYGKLLKGGEPDLNTVSKMILNDWMRGKIPYFTMPPQEDVTQTEESNNIDEKDLNKIGCEAALKVLKESKKC
ncbi:GTPase required for pre-60S ribosomal subunit nuclear export and maturation [Clydaea vesicula]|uniref:Nucleolar GTP-binding protein 2 n=1 Tax=Clydaea vesicula TaxID=447962 RepID=A0AAD5XRX3_9FUNG|nr:GTPase required for pre-60S ribosomal subunit nuclear export and maturation [Clydaea vesicula]